MPRTSTENLPIRLMSISQLAAILGVSRFTVYNMRAKGLLPNPVYVSASPRWPEDVLREWIAKGCPPCEDTPQAADCLRQDPNATPFGLLMRPDEGDR